ncbi:MAG TPA: hypothetical protein VIY68_11805 [Steroidobacteraceae bacterium]
MMRILIDRRKFSMALLMAVLASMSIHPTRVLADARVMLCSDADQVGAGMNLRTALKQSVNPETLVNSIVFDCPTGSSIQVRSPLEVTQATRIDGANQLTLAAGGAPGTPMFVLEPAEKFFYLYNLSLIDAQKPPFQTCISKSPGGNCGLSRILVAHDVVELHNVTVSGVHYPFGMKAGTFGIYNSRLVGNVGTVLTTAGPATVTINQSAFLNNHDLPLTVRGALTIENNSSFANNGTVVLGPATGMPCLLKVERSSFNSNGSPNFGAFLSSCDASIGHSTFTSNTSGAPGAALSLSGQNLMLRADTFLQNRSGIALTAAVKMNGGAVSWTPGGAGGVMTVLFSNFRENSSTASGGAIVVGRSESSAGPQTLNIGASSFTKNAARTEGGAIAAYNTQVHTARAIFSTNTAGGTGGAIYVSNASAIEAGFANTLFVQNRASTGGAFSGDGAAFVNSTIYGNSSAGIFVAAPGRAPKHVTLSNTIVAKNSAGDCTPKGLVTNLGDNLQYPGNDCGTGIVVADPQLDPTYIPLPRGTSMGHGNVAVCAAAPVGGADVYGVARLANHLCSIGAAEGDVEVLGGVWSAFRNPASLANNFQSLTTRLAARLREAGFTDAWLSAHPVK